jgi:uncharacterized protein
MEQQRFGNHYVLRLDPGDEIMGTLKQFAEQEGVRGGFFFALGAFSRARLRYLNMKTKQYEDINIDEQVEVVSLLGNVAMLPDGKHKVHMHASVADENGRTYSGHIGDAEVRPTLEVFLTKLDGELRREEDEESGMEVLALGQAQAQAQARRAA